MNRYVNAMRSLALQAINKAKQGHSGMSISAAPIVYTLYKGLMTISKSHPKWFNRDRLVLSAGHGSMALYPVFYFSSLLTLDDIKNFRNDNYLTPGHPEVLANNYIDASTGPLGQGVANAVGMAITESYLRTEFATLKGVIDYCWRWGPTRGNLLWGNEYCWKIKIIEINYFTWFKWLPIRFSSKWC